MERNYITAKSRRNCDDDTKHDRREQSGLISPAVCWTKGAWYGYKRCLFLDCRLHGCFVDPTCPACKATMQGTECANCGYTVSADPVSWITAAGGLGSMPNTCPMCGHGMNNECPNCGFTTSIDIGGLVSAMLAWVRSNRSETLGKLSILITGKEA